jgi:hypothetical protein
MLRQVIRLVQKHPLRVVLRIVSSISPRTPVKYYPFPPRGGRRGWGAEARMDVESHASPPPLPSPIEGEGV